MRGFSAGLASVVVVVLALVALAAVDAALPEVKQLRKRLEKMELKAISVLSGDICENSYSRLHSREAVFCSLASHLMQSVKDVRHSIIAPVVSMDNKAAAEYILAVLEAYKKADIETDVKLTALAEISSKMTGDSDPSQEVVSIIRKLSKQQTEVAEMVAKEFEKDHVAKRLVGQVVVDPVE